MKFQTMIQMVLFAMACSLAAFGQAQQQYGNIGGTSDLIVSGTVLDVQMVPADDMAASGLEHGVIGSGAMAKPSTLYRITVQVDQTLLGAKPATPTVTFTVPVYANTNPAQTPPITKGAQAIFGMQKSKVGLVCPNSKLVGIPMTELANVQNLIKTSVISATLSIPKNRIVYGETTEVTLKLTNPTDTDFTLSNCWMNGFYFAPKMENNIPMNVQLNNDPQQDAPVTHWNDVVVKAKGTASVTFYATCNVPTSLALLGEDSYVQIPAAVFATVSYITADKKMSQTRAGFLRVLIGYPLPKVDDNFIPIPDDKPAGDTPAK